MKPRNVVISLVVNYLAIIFVSAIIEIVALGNVAQHIQLIMRTAADMSLEQAQVTDDFFVKNNGYRATGTAYKLSMPSADGSGYTTIDMFDGIYNLNTSKSENKEKAFMKVYDNAEFKEFSKTLGNIRTPLRYYNSSNTGFEWYSVPKISFMGLDVLNKSSASVTGVKNSSGAYVSGNVANGLFNTYGLSNHKKDGGMVTYYNTPISLGITYLNKDLLSTLYMNNVDLLMRSKYAKSGFNLNTSKGGNGVLKGSTYASLVKGDLSAYNPINDGLFTVLRGTQSTTSANNVKAFKGTQPDIVYKVINMYDPANNDLLVMLFGANTGGMGSKAAYLKSLDNRVINPMTGRPYDEKNIVVAKVTFYLDVIVPYTTIIARDFRGNLDKTTTNFLDLQRSNSNGKRGASGNTMLEYTRYFAVTP